MDKKPKDDKELIKYMIRSIQLIRQYTNEINEEEFTNNTEKQDAVMRELIVIGEAAKNVSDSFKAKNGVIEWKELAAVRNVVVHQYFRINVKEIWKIVQKDLPPLEEKLEVLL